MNAQQTLSNHLALFILSSAFGKLTDVPTEAPSELGERGAALLTAAHAARDGWWEPNEPTSPAATRLERNSHARHAAEALDAVMRASSDALTPADTKRLRQAANALSLGWEEVDAFLAR